MLSPNDSKLKSEQLLLIPSDLIAPCWVLEGHKRKVLVPSSGDIYALSGDLLLPKIKKLQSFGIRTVAIYPLITESEKVSKAEEIYSSESLLANTLKEIKRLFPKLQIMVEVGLDQYNLAPQVIKNFQDTHFQDENNNTLINKQALMLAISGADILLFNPPEIKYMSSVKKELLANEFQQLTLISKATNFSSALYGMHEDIRHQNEDREFNHFNISKNLETNMANIREHFLAGADFIMFEPALLYLDVLRDIKKSLNIPFMANQIAGEYLLLKAAIKSKIYTERSLILETLAAIKRAGAVKIHTLYAAKAAAWLNEGLDGKRSVLARPEQVTDGKPEETGKPKNEAIAHFIEINTKVEPKAENPHTLFGATSEAAVPAAAKVVVTHEAKITEQNKKANEHQAKIIHADQNKKNAELVQHQNEEAQNRQNTEMTQKQNFEAEVLQNIIIQDAMNRSAQELNAIQNKQTEELTQKIIFEAQELDKNNQQAAEQQEAENKIAPAEHP